MRWLAIWIECVSNDFADLAPRRIIVRAEIWPVLWRHAWLSGPTTRIARHYFPRCQSFNKVIEGGSCTHIFEGLPRHRLTKARSIRYDLRYLPSGRVVVWPEIRQVLRRHADFVHRTARVSVYDTSVAQTPHIVIESRPRCYVLELLPIGNLIESCSISHDLGKLPPSYVIVRPEGAVWIPIDDTYASEASDVRVERRAFHHVTELNDATGR
jgi:hypothetical protein